MMDAGENNYDAKKYNMCCPWDGQPGPGFQRKFWPNFLSAAQGKVDKFASWFMHMECTGPGCVAKCTAAELANPAFIARQIGFSHTPTSQIGVEERAAYKMRDEQIVASLRKHILSPSLKTEIDRLVKLIDSKDYANGAPCLDLVYTAATQANAATIAYPTGHPQFGTAVSPADLDTWKKVGNSKARCVPYHAPPRRARGRGDSIPAARCGSLHIAPSTWGCEWN